MPDKPSDEAVAKSSDVDNKTPGNNSDPKDDQISNLNSALRSERSVIKDLKKEVDILKNGQLEEQGKFKELYDNQKTEFEKLQSQVSEYDSFFSSSLEEAKAKVSAEVLGLLPSNLSPKEQLSWITKASETFSPGPQKPGPLNTRGSINPPGDQNRLSVTQEEFMQMSPSERQKHLDEVVELRGFGGLQHKTN